MRRQISLGPLPGGRVSNSCTKVSCGIGATGIEADVGASPGPVYWGNNVAPFGYPPARTPKCPSSLDNRLLELRHCVPRLEFVREGRGRSCFPMWRGLF